MTTYASILARILMTSGSQCIFLPTIDCYCSLELSVAILIAIFVPNSTSSMITFFLLIPFFLKKNPTRSLAGIFPSSLYAFKCLYVVFVLNVTLDKYQFLGCQFSLSMLKILFYCLCHLLLEKVLIYFFKG